MDRYVSFGIVMTTEKGSLWFPLLGDVQLDSETHPRIAFYPEDPNKLVFNPNMQSIEVLVIKCSGDECVSEKELDNFYRDFQLIFKLSVKYPEFNLKETDIFEADNEIKHEEVL
jgi:hypothetical protein